MANKKFYVTIYNTNKPDYEIDRYLTNQMSVRSVNDVKPTKQYECANNDEATQLYEQLRLTNNVVAKFDNKYLLVVTNKN